MSALLSLLRDEGILLDGAFFSLVKSFEDEALALHFLRHVTRFTGHKMLSTALFTQYPDCLARFLDSLSPAHQVLARETFTRQALSFTSSPAPLSPLPRLSPGITYSVHYAPTTSTKKLDVSDFVGHFRTRYQQLQRILMGRPDLHNLIALNKLGSDRQQVSVIGMVSGKRMSKKGNLILSIEDLTGRISAVIRMDKEELVQKGGEIQLDDVIALKCSGNRDMLFVQDVLWPDAFIPVKSHFESDISMAFISDTHCGSNRHLGTSLNNFIDWLGSDDPEAAKIRFLFIPGDTVDGVGVFPGQEFQLKEKQLRMQYELLASYLARVPKHITMFLCPGQHDASRVAEPQPPPHKHYAAPLYELENLVLVSNPTLVILKEGSREFKVLMYHGASIHSFISEIPELRLGKAHRTPAKAVRFMLKRRHLAPTHSEVTYIPNSEHDPLVITQVHDILCTGEVHRLDIENYNGVLIITGSCWQGQTPFEEKVGNIPDPCKVPVVNLKTRELRVYDFGDPAELAELGGTTEGSNEH
jgi:DNA polymerase II small subunit